MLQNELEEEAADAHTLNSITEIRESVQLAIEILNEMLLYDKLSTGKLELELKFTNIPRLVRRSAVSFKLAAAKKAIGLYVLDNEMDLDSLQDLRVQCDVNKISQVIRYLNRIFFKKSFKNYE
jgi:signal transduction histidine kinase